MENPKLIVVLGPTASGKTELALKLAKKFNGEIVSADSRQIYKGMDIGTGKITKKEMRGIPHHLLDVASPKKIFTVSQYRKLALDAINKIFKKNKLPILCGGTGFYIQAVIDGIIIPEVPPDWKLRKKLEKKSIKELYELLRKSDPKRAELIDKQNPRRLIRAIEIVTKTKKPVPAFKQNPLPYPILIIGLKVPKNELKKRIEKRVEKMLKYGLKKEIGKFSIPTIGYQEELSKNLIVLHTLQYAKRQTTWFKRDERIIWVENYKEAEKLAKKFIK